VSLWSRERLVIGLAPESLTALRLGGIIRGRIQEQRTIPLKAAGAPPAELIVDAMEVLLDTPDWGGREITVILSSHFVHHALIPKGAGLSMKEQHDLAQVLFHKTYGELSREWDIRASPASGAPTLASGVPRALLTAIRAICDGRGRLRSIQPALMSVFNRTRSAIGADSGTFALVEPGRITLAALERGQWQAIASRAVAGTTLPQLLDEENELHGHNRGGMLWLADLTGTAQLPSSASWHLRQLANPRLKRSAAEPASLAAWGVE
jgi:hypothetical protein